MEIRNWGSPSWHSPLLKLGKRRLLFCRSPLPSIPSSGTLSKKHTYLIVLLRTFNSSLSSPVSALYSLLSLANSLYQTPSHSKHHLSKVHAGIWQTAQTLNSSHEQINLILEANNNIIEIPLQHASRCWSCVLTMCNDDLRLWVCIACYYYYYSLIQNHTCILFYFVYTYSCHILEQGSLIIALIWYGVVWG